MEKEAFSEIYSNECSWFQNLRFVKNDCPNPGASTGSKECLNKVEDIWLNPEMKWYPIQKEKGSF